jgi:DNA-binding NarL/FixJ family response regulator
MPVQVLAASKNYKTLKYLQNKLGEEIVMKDFCKLLDAGDMYCILKPAVLLMEIKWPHATLEEVYETISELLRIKPEARIVAMTTTYNPEIERAVYGIGACGYVFLECLYMTEAEVIEHFKQSILKASAGTKYFTVRMK